MIPPHNVHNIHKHHHHQNHLKRFQAQVVDCFLLTSKLNDSSQNKTVVFSVLFFAEFDWLIQIFLSDVDLIGIFASYFLLTTLLSLDKRIVFTLKIQTKRSLNKYYFF